MLSQSLTHALFDLAAAPEYIQPLREEIESVLAVEGWTKIAMGKMWKLDSFLKESQRVNGLTLGTRISCASHARSLHLRPRLRA